MTTGDSNPSPRLPWPDALAHAVRTVASTPRRPFLVGITGPVAAGKSTFAERLLLASLGPQASPDSGTPRPAGAISSTPGLASPRTLPGVDDRIILSTDQYLPDYDLLAEHERDLPEHADLSRLALDLGTLSTGDAAEVPVWSFHSHRREGSARVAARSLIIVEGIHALHDRIRHAFDLRIFVEASPASRWSRWEAIEASGARGWGVAKARRYFDAVAEPTFRAREHEYRRHAHLLVLNEGTFDP